MTHRLYLAVTLRESDCGLLGGDYEYNPYLTYSSSWGEHRVATHAQTGFKQVGPFQLPAPQDVRGDERVWLRMGAKCRHSGIPTIDEQEKGQVEYDAQCGLKDLLLTDLLYAAQQSKTLEVPLMDPQLLLAMENELLKNKDLNERERESAAILRSFKGMLLVTPSLSRTAAGNPANGQPLLQALQTAASKESLSNLMYGSPLMVKAMQQMQNRCLVEYSNNFYGRFNADGTPAGPPKYPLGKEKSLEHMHLPVVVSDYGILPPIALTQYRISTREGLKLSAADRQRYGPTRQSALLANKLLASAALKQGLNPSAFTSAIRAQHTQSPSDSGISESYLLATVSISKMATDTGNAIKYQKDMRYPNKATIPEFNNTPVQQQVQPTAAMRHASRITLAGMRSWGTGMPMGKHHRYLVGSWRSAHRFSSTNQPEAEKKEPATYDVEVECLDSLPLLGICASDDCDASGSTAGDVLRNLPRLATAVSREEAPLLHAAVEVCSFRMVADVVASVGAAFVDTSGAKLSREATKGMQDLPMIGDAMDLRREVGGHYHGLWQSKYVYAIGLEATGVDLQRELPLLVDKNYPAWVPNQPTLGLEGTAAIDPLILPAGEIAQAIMRTGGEAQAFEARMAARKELVHTLLPAVSASSSSNESVAETSKSALLNHTHAEGMSFYSAKQYPERRVSSFYMGISHLLVPELYAMNPRYGQLSVVNHRDQTRGGEISAVLRMPFHGKQSELGFVPTLGGISKAEWDSQIRPVMAAIQNQMPLAAVDYFPTEEAATQASLRVGCVLPPTVLAKGFVNSHLTVAESMERYALGLHSRLSTSSTMAAAAVAVTKMHLLAQAQGVPSRLMAQSSSTSASNVPDATITVPFTIQPYVLQEPGAMEAVVQELNEKVAAGTLTHYSIVADRPLPCGEDVVTIVATLPAPIQASLPGH